MHLDHYSQVHLLYHLGMQPLKHHQRNLQMGREHGQQLPLSELHEELLSSAVENGLGELDNSAIIELIRKLT